MKTFSVRTGGAIKRAELFVQWIILPDPTIIVEFQKSLYLE